MNNGKTSRRFLTPALATLALAGSLAAGTAATVARAEDGTAAAPAKVDLEAGRELFDTWSCSACHTLSDAGSTGAVGPSLDNPDLTHDFIVNRIMNGSGPMPSFGGQIPQADIDTLANYIVAANHEDAAPAVASAPAAGDAPAAQ